MNLITQAFNSGSIAVGTSGYVTVLEQTLGRGPVREAEFGVTIATNNLLHFRISRKLHENGAYIAYLTDTDFNIGTENLPLSPGTPFASVFVSGAALQMRVYLGSAWAWKIEAQASGGAATVAVLGGVSASR